MGVCAELGLNVAVGCVPVGRRDGFGVGCIFIVGFTSFVVGECVGGGVVGPRVFLGDGLGVEWGRRVGERTGFVVAFAVGEWVGARADGAGDATGRTVGATGEWVGTLAGTGFCVAGTPFVGTIVVTATGATVGFDAATGDDVEPAKTFEKAKMQVRNASLDKAP
jgi:hypothetical protein